MSRKRSDRQEHHQGQRLSSSDWSFHPPCVSYCPRASRRVKPPKMTSFKTVQERTEKLVERLIDFSGLARSLVSNLVMYVKSLVRPGTDEIDDVVFMALMSKRFNVTNTNILSLMFNSNKSVKATHMTVEQFCRCMCIFITENLDQRVEFVFRCYDLNADNFLSRAEVYTLLKPSIPVSELEDQDVEETIREFLEIVYSLADIVNNEMISLEDYRAMVRQDNLYLEFLGQVLPTRDYVDKFLHRIVNKSPMQVKRRFLNERCDLLCELREREKLSLYPIMLETP